MTPNDLFEEEKFTVRRFSARSALRFAELVERLESRVHILDPNRGPEGPQDVNLLAARITQLAEPSGFVIVAKIEHRLLEKMGRPGHSVQYAIGNPLVAAEITTRAIEGALYAPFRLAIIAADGENGSRIEFDDPADLMGSLGNAEVAAIGETLSAKLKALIRSLI